MRGGQPWQERGGVGIDFGSAGLRGARLLKVGDKMMVWMQHGEGSRALIPYPDPQV